MRKLPPLPETGFSHPANFNLRDMESYARTCVKAALEEAANLFNDRPGTSALKYAAAIRKLSGEIE